MKVCTSICFALVSNAALADCDPVTAGTWLLDYQHYLDVASKGKPSTRKELDEIWGGKPFVKLSLDPDAGRGSRASRHGEDWHSYGFTYQITVERGGSCTMTVVIDGGPLSAQHETYSFWSTDSGFCMLPLGSDRWEDCFTADPD